MVTRTFTDLDPAASSTSSPNRDSDSSELREWAVVAEQAKVDSMVHVQQAFYQEGAD